MTTTPTKAVGYRAKRSLDPHRPSWHHETMITITDEVEIDEQELSFEYARSSGPGGQNVNKVETKVTLRFSLAATRSLNSEQKQLIGDRLRGRITKDGVMRVVCQRHRTREANRKECLDRFAALLAAALEIDPDRKPTRVPKSSRRRRVENKKRRSRVKKMRRRVTRDDEP
jgi:ribosome-associated protein